MILQAGVFAVEQQRLVLVAVAAAGTVPARIQEGSVLHGQTSHPIDLFGVVCAYLRASPLGER